MPENQLKQPGANWYSFAYNVFTNWYFMLSNRILGLRAKPDVGFSQYFADISTAN